MIGITVYVVAHQIQLRASAVLVCDFDIAKRWLVGVMKIWSTGRQIDVLVGFDIKVLGGKRFYQHFIYARNRQHQVSAGLRYGAGDMYVKGSRLHE